LPDAAGRSRSACSGSNLSRSPGWQESAPQIASSVEKRIARAIAVVFSSASALAQTTTNAPTSPAAGTPPATTDEPDDRAWSFSGSVYTYIAPDDGSYVQPTVTADRGWLHLEARYNYEALDTGSA
jgi:hypothetical protein